MLALAALTLALQVPQSDSIELAWRPEPGTTFAREIDFEIRGGLDDAWAGWLPSALEGLAAVSIAGRMRVSDEVRGVADGRPIELLRTYERLETVWDGLARHDVRPELLERELRFAWDERAGDWERTWVRPASRAGAPPALREDLDLRALLPGEPVRVGDLWRVPVSSVAGLLAPAGALHVDAELGEAWGFDELARAFDLERVQRIRDGQVECLLERIVRADGRRLAVIEVGWTWWGTIDPFLTPSAGTFLARIAHGSIRADLDGRAWGRLLWDLDGGHAQEFELQAELSGQLGDPHSRGGLRFHARGTWFTTITPR